MIDIDSLIVPGHRHFYRLENSGGKVWLLPVSGLATALGLYQPSGLKGVLLKKLLPLLHRLTPVRRMVRAEEVACDLPVELTECAARAFGVERMDYSIFGGTPSVHRKITIQFYDAAAIYGYGKVTDSHDISALFFHEQNLLERLHSAGINNIPECLYCGELPSGLMFFIQTTRKSRHSCSPAQWTRFHEQFMKDLALKTNKRQLFDSTDFAASLRGLRDGIARLPGNYRDTVKQKIDSVFERLGGTEVEYCAFHADFTPWNMFVDNEELFVFDWEYGRMSYPPMLDRYHFHIQQALHVDRLTPARTLERIEQFDWFDREELRFYLLDIISRFTLREKGPLSPELLSNIDFWIRMMK